MPGVAADQPAASESPAPTNGEAHLHSLSPTNPAPPLPLATNRVVVPKLAGEIKCDGNLDEPAWAKAAVIGPFVRTRNAAPEREHTELRLWYDDKALYLGWTCRDVDIQATLTNRDDSLFEEEVVEFFVAPKELKRYFEFEWNPLGTVFDAEVQNDLGPNGRSKGIHDDLGYTAKTMQSAAKVHGTLNNSTDRDESWQVEIRLPFADLGQPCPHPGEVWRVNFYRVNRTKNLPAEFLAWSPTLSSSFHQPSRFGYLEFGP